MLPSQHQRIVLAASLLLAILVSKDVIAGALTSGEAPGPKSQTATWSSSRLTFLGTSPGKTSRVWFTGFDGIIGQVFYPRVDIPATVDWQFMIGDSARTWVDEEKVDTTSTVTQVDSKALSWKIVNTAKKGMYQIEKTVFTDPNRDSLVVRVKFAALGGKTIGDFNLYTLYHPALDDNGLETTASTVRVSGTSLLAAQNAQGKGTKGAFDRGSTSVIVSSLPFRPGMMSSGFVGQSDGWQDLKGGQKPDFTMDWTYDSATSGNVAQMGLFDFSTIAGKASIEFDLVLGFGASVEQAAKTANATLADDLGSMLSTFNAGWKAYTAGLDNQGGTADQQYYVAAMALKAAQDKGTTGIVAGLGTPWGEDQYVPDGYHVVFPRDLYKFASALIVAGDPATARSALDFLLDKMEESDGHFPRYDYVDGSSTESPQLDQVAFPIVLAWKVGRTNSTTYVQHIKPAADFLVRSGPKTGAERWEEAPGFSPSTIAAEIAGLVCAADIARSNGDIISERRYFMSADYWQRLVESWTFTTHGGIGNGRYYERIDGDGNPEDDNTLSIASCGGNPKEHDIVDAGFLELVRHGVKPWDDPYVVASLKAVDATIKRTISGKGDGYFRYNFDGYGENKDGDGWPKATALCSGASHQMDEKGIGRLWPILTGERGHYLLARGNDASAQLETMRKFANASFLIPEQVFDPSVPPGFTAGTPTKSMCPLNWAMGEYITLVGSNAKKKPLDRPEIVFQRYVTGAFMPAVGKSVDFQAADAVQGKALTIFYKGKLAGAAELTLNATFDSPGGPVVRPMVQRADGFWQASVPIPMTATSLSFKFTDGTGTTDDNGGANWTTPIAPSSFQTSVTPFDAWPSPAAAGQIVKIFYKGPLSATATRITLHWWSGGGARPPTCR